MTLTFRDVKGSALTAAEFDGNTRDLDGRVSTLEAAFTSNPAIDSFEVIGDQFYVHFDDYTTLGPYTLPAIVWNPRGAFIGGETYLVHDLIVSNRAVYEVLLNHVADSTFDEGATDGSGNDLYRLLIPASAITADVEETELEEFIFSISKANKYIRCIRDGGTRVIIPKDATVNHDISTEGVFRQCQPFVSPVIFEPEDETVILNYIDGCLLETDTRGAVVTIKKVAANTWDIFGLLALDPSS